MNPLELFYLVAEGDAHWAVCHQVTDELAGCLFRTPLGFVLKDEELRTIGTFETTEAALRGLYALV
jgi:hypothetical protein